MIDNTKGDIYLKLFNIDESVYLTTLRKERHNRIQNLMNFQLEGEPNEP